MFDWCAVCAVPGPRTITIMVVKRCSHAYAVRPGRLHGSNVVQADERD